MTDAAVSNPLRLLIFDCDGVLVDSEGPTLSLMAAFFTRNGLPMTSGEADTLFVGGTLRSAGEEAIRRGASLPEGWFADLNGSVIARMAEGVPLIPGVTDLIDQAEAAGITIAVASNGPMEKMRASLGPSGLYQRLESRIYSGHVHGTPKPAPDLVLHAMAQAGVTPSETAMIDDSPSGCRAAVAAGVRCFGFADRGQAAALAAVGAEPVPDMATIAARLGL